MCRKRRKVDDRSDLPAERGSEDGSDPKEFHARPWNAPKQASRKGQQLCGQIKDVLQVVLAGSASSVLQNLSLVSVEPAPHTGRLRILVSAEDRPATKLALERAAGYLRHEVAQAICRRYTPELVFEVVG
jgi:ribosome-binding factor A